MRNGAPFSKPRVRLYGNTGDAQDYLGAAYNLLFKVRQFCEATGAPVFAMQHSLPDGAVVQAAILGNEEIVSCFPPTYVTGVAVPSTRTFPRTRTSRLVWIPEGFVITPRNAGAPKGWGLPETEDGRGTPGGPIRQTVINQFKHNKYPDVLFRAIPPTDDMRFFAAPFFYTNDESATIGFADGRINKESLPKGWKVLAPGEEEIIPDWIGAEYDEIEGVVEQSFVKQIEPRWRERVTEKERDEWFCHRPQQMKYVREDEELVPARYDVPSDLLNDIFVNTNLYRASQSRDPLFAPLRGYYNGLARSVVVQMARSGVQAHDSDEFQEGYQKFLERVYRFAQPLDYAGENLITHPPGAVPSGATLGEAMVSSWIASPGHRSNILFNWTGQDWDNADEIAGVLELSTGSGAITKVQAPPYTQPAQDVTPVSGTMASQAFSRTDRWVYESVLLWEGDAGQVAISDVLGGPFRYTTVNFPIYRHVLTIDRVDSVRVNGRYINLLEPSDRHILMGAALYREEVEVEKEGGIGVAVVEKLFLNAAYYYLPDTQDVPCEFRLITWDVDKLPSAEDGEDFPAPERVIDYPLPAETFAVSRVLFSQSGKKCTFTYHEREARPDSYVRYNEGDFSQRAGLPITLYGTSLTHVEFMGDVFVASPKQEVLVSVDAGRIGGVQNTYQGSCSGSYVIWRDYEGNTLFNILCEGESTVRQGFPEPGALSIRHFGKLIFPKGEFVHADIGTEGAHNESGFVNLLRHFDARNPEDTVYIRLNPTSEIAPFNEFGLTYTAFRLRQALVFADEEVKINANVMIHDDENDSLFVGLDTLPWGGQRVFTPNPFVLRTGSGTYIERSFFRYSSENAGAGAAFPADEYGIGSGELCAATHHASLHPKTIGTQTVLKYPHTSRLTQEFSFAPHVAFAESDSVDRTGDTPVGPVDFSINGLADVSFVRYRDEHLMAGQFGQVFGLKKHGQQGDDQYFWRSSLDLKEITGVEDLSDNILPIGVV